jgi:hypothetical protein
LTRSSAVVHTNVEGVWRKLGLQLGSDFLDQSPQIIKFVGGQIENAGGMCFGNDQRMTL